MTDKIKLFRRGRYCGLVNEDFYMINNSKERPEVFFNDHLGLDRIC